MNKKQQKLPANCTKLQKDRKEQHEIPENSRKQLKIAGNSREMLIHSFYLPKRTFLDEIIFTTNQCESANPPKRRQKSSKN